MNLSLVWAQATCPEGQTATQDSKVPCCPNGQALVEGVCVAASGVGGLVKEGETIGSGGLGSRGGGLGGGGTATGLEGLGSKSSSKPTPQSAGTAISGGDPIILGALDKAAIETVMQGSWSKVSACASAGLAKNPQLTGQTTVKFVIDKYGNVSSAAIKTTTLNNAEVEACLTGVVQTLRFPEVPGGGIVIVSYPFAIKPSP